MIGPDSEALNLSCLKCLFQFTSFAISKALLTQSLEMTFDSELHRPRPDTGGSHSAMTISTAASGPGRARLSGPDAGFQCQSESNYGPAPEPSSSSGLLSGSAGCPSHGRVRTQACWAGRRAAPSRVARPPPAAACRRPHQWARSGQPRRRHTPSSGTGPGPGPRRWPAADAPAARRLGVRQSLTRTSECHWQPGHGKSSGGGRPGRHGVWH